MIHFIQLGDIQGIALLAGCNNVLVRQDFNIVNVATQLIEKDVLVLATGCSAGALAKCGLMSPEATDRLAGPGLSSVLSLPEAMSEKALSIASSAVALGLVVHFGVQLPINGSPLVVEYLTHDVRQELGGAFLFESNPVQAARKMVKIVQSRRESLGL